MTLTIVFSFVMAILAIVASALVNSAALLGYGLESIVDLWASLLVLPLLLPLCMAVVSQSRSDTSLPWSTPPLLQHWPSAALLSQVLWRFWEDAGHLGGLKANLSRWRRIPLA